jgi:hypothetical protein
VYAALASSDTCKFLPLLVDPLPQSDAPAIKAIIVLDGSGKRLVAKYYSKTEFPTKARQARALATSF